MRILFATLTLHDEPLGIMYLSAILKNQGHQVRGVMLQHEDLFAAVKEFKPALVGYSAMDCERVPVLRLNAQLKKSNPGLFSIIGGPLGTFSPDVISDEAVDAVCLGEAEEALPELVSTLEQGGDIKGIRNLWIKIDRAIHKNPLRPLARDLDSIPFPDRTLFGPPKKGGTANLIASRGCTYNCTYCHNKRYKELYSPIANRIRRRSVDNVIAEVKEIDRKSNPSVFFFQEDHFYSSITSLEEFAKKYRAEVGKPFICAMRPECLVDKQRVKALKDANCVSIFTGCEAGNDRIRKRILKRNMTKDHILLAAQTMSSFGIRFVFQNMVGIPTSTFEDDLETLELNMKCKPYYAWASICTPYPATELFTLAQEAGAIPDNYLDALYETYHYRSSLNIPQAPQVDILHKVFALVVEYPQLYPIIKRPDFYRDTGDERLKALKQVFDAFKAFKYDNLSQEAPKVPEVVTKFVSELLKEEDLACAV